MARNSIDSGDDNIDPASVTCNLKSSVKQEIIKELLNGSFQDNKTKLGNDALTLVVEVAKCLVTETCLRAASHALREGCDKVDIEHVEKCLTQLFELGSRSEDEGSPNITLEQYISMKAIFPYIFH